MTGALVVTRWELLRLSQQLRIRMVLIACLLGPWLFVVGLQFQQQTPKDTIFGIWVHTSGWAIPLVVLGFASTWVFPMLVAAIAGGVFAGDDETSVWPALLTRSKARGQVFAGKCLAAVLVTITAALLLGASSIVAGVVVVGHQPLIGLSGTVLSGKHLAWLVLASWLTQLPAAVGFTALGLMLSTLLRSSVAAVLVLIGVGLLMELDSLITAGDVFRHGLLTNPLQAWHGLFTSPEFTYPLVRGCIVSAVWTVVCLAVAATAFNRREFASG